MELKNKKVIVTGGAGVIGRELIARLRTQGALAHCFDIAPRPPDWSNDVLYSQTDLARLNPIAFVNFNPDLVFHLAAIFERTEEELGFWDLNFQNEIMVNQNVLDAAKKCRTLKKFIFASSYLIYDPALYLSKRPPDKAVWLSEKSATNPRNLCGASKLYAEKQLEFLNHFKKDCPWTTVSARIFRVYGRNSKDIISRWIRAVLRGQTLEVFLPENQFDYIYAGEVAEGLLRLAKSDQASGIFNLGTGQPSTIETVIQTIKKSLPLAKIKKIRRAGQWEASAADLARLTKILAWQPSPSLEKGIAQVIAYEKKQFHK